MKKRLAFIIMAAMTVSFCLAGTVEAVDPNTQYTHSTLVTYVDGFANPISDGLEVLSTTSVVNAENGGTLEVWSTVEPGVQLL